VNDRQLEFFFDRAPTGEPIPPREYFALEMARDRRRRGAPRGAGRRRWPTAAELAGDVEDRLEAANRQLRELGGPGGGVSPPDTT
jgi:hypothetical protein